jgi:hypothetical protein
LIALIGLDILATSLIPLFSLIYLIDFDLFSSMESLFIGYFISFADLMSTFSYACFNCFKGEFVFTGFDYASSFVLTGDIALRGDSTFFGDINLDDYDFFGDFGDSVCFISDFRSGVGC